jgi:hypothetical protein
VDAVTDCVLGKLTSATCPGLPELEIRKAQR